MMRLTQLVAGAALFIGGTAKAMHHVGAADPMAAYWCRTPGTQLSVDTWLFSGHCWGCVAAVVGAGMLIAAAVSHVRRDKGATPRPVRLRAVEPA